MKGNTMKLFTCPICGRRKPASHFTCANVSKAGAAGRGACKARTPEQARAAAMARWAKARKGTRQ